LRVVFVSIILSFLISCEKIESYTLDTIIFPDLSGTLNIYNGTFSPGEEIIIEAYPNEYYEFVSWGGSVSGEDSKISIIMNENKLIYAEFKLKDSDGDGINDDIDRCNDTPAGLLVNNFGCSSLQADYDKDGIINELDICPNTPYSTSVSSNGCPLIYLDENGVTLRATPEAVDSIGKTVKFKGNNVEIIRDWEHIKSLNPGSYKSTNKLVTTFLEETNVLCALPCQINDNFDMAVWDVSNVKTMYFTFWNLNGFNQDISIWDVSKVEDMEGLFFHSYNLNVDVSSWDVSSVKSMKRMFRGAYNSNPDVSLWDVSNVLNMLEMFYETDINQDLKQWNVKSTTNMEKMFYGAKFFNQDLSNWNVDNVENCDSFYEGADAWVLPKPNFLKCNPN
tara:strand:- start:4179 stop:5354 length:1176 start_codon:yes stop_codon:yes gene_type:complete